MDKKFSVIIEDDWELLGNGLGNVASHQYLPSLVFMKMAKKLDIKLTFMVDAAQQLEFNKYQDRDANFRLQKNLWDNSISLMREYGFDVQLHLHPQWLNASLNGDLYYLNNNWNIGKYDSLSQQNLIKNAINYLHALIRKYEPDYEVIAYKGGSWGLQPSENLFRSLEEEGIKIVMGVRKGMYIPENGVDYKNLEEEFLPYYPLYKDIQQVSNKTEKIFIIPLQSYQPGLGSLASLYLDMVQKKITKKSVLKYYYQSEIDNKILNLSPLNSNKKLQFGLHPYRTHLKIGNQPFGYLKNSFDATIERLKHINKTNIPIVIETHTKQFHDHYADIEKFLIYIKNKYDDSIEFKDITTYYKELKDSSEIVVGKKENNISCL